MADVLADIQRLLPMLDMAYRAEQMKMAKIVTRMNELNAQLSALERPEHGDDDSLSAATLAGADLLWQGWVQNRKSLINRELALASRDRESAKTSLVKALSKLEAAKQMMARVQSDARRLSERRSSW